MFSHNATRSCNTPIAPAATNGICVGAAQPFDDEDAASLAVGAAAAVLEELPFEGLAEELNVDTVLVTAVVVVAVDAVLVDVDTAAALEIVLVIVEPPDVIVVTTAPPAGGVEIVLVIVKPPDVIVVTAGAAAVERVLVIVEPPDVIVVTAGAAVLETVLTKVDPPDVMVARIGTRGTTLDPGIVVTAVLPAESVLVTTRGAPGIPVLAAPRSALMADSSDWMFAWYSEGMLAGEGVASSVDCRAAASVIEAAD